MSIKVLELTKNSELVELSIDEQIKIQGGVLLIGNQTNTSSEQLSNILKIQDQNERIRQLGKVALSSAISSPF